MNGYNALVGSIETHREALGQEQTRSALAQYYVISNRANTLVLNEMGSQPLDSMVHNYSLDTYAYIPGNKIVIYVLCPKLGTKRYGGHGTRPSLVWLRGALGPPLTGSLPLLRTIASWWAPRAEH